MKFNQELLNRGAMKLWIQINVWWTSYVLHPITSRTAVQSTYS